MKTDDDHNDKITRRSAIAVSLGTVGAAALGGMLEAAPPPSVKSGRRIWTVTNPDTKNPITQFRLRPEDLGTKATGCSVEKRILQSGLSMGVETIEVDNGKMSFVVLPTRGMGIWQARCGNVRLGWDSPVNGPVNPAFVRLDAPDGLGWLAGFDEMLVRCGLEYNGGPEFQDNGILRYGLHGRISNTPAHKVEVSVDEADGRISVTGVVDEARLYGNKLRLRSTVSTLPGRAKITIRDTVENLSAEPGELQLIYHTNFGPPLLGSGAKVIAVTKRVTPFDDVAAKGLSTWNVMGVPVTGAPEQCFACELSAMENGNTAVMLQSPDRRSAVLYRFNKKQLPCFTIWKNPQPASDGYAIGLEPGTNYPYTKTQEKQQGRVISLPPGDSKTFELSLEYLPDSEAVRKAQNEIQKIE
ncbi:MAG: aldose 1-epimerase family protein [Pirellulales bacterium]|nr:aldose 1-epimerase family protein [Pirellulales bacterium]